MWAFYEDFESEKSDQHTEHEESKVEKFENEVENDAKTKEEVKLQEALLTSIQREGSFRMRGVLARKKIITLLYTNATHNFIDAKLVERRGIQTEEFEGIRVKVVDGYTLKCDRMIADLPM